MVLEDLTALANGPHHTRPKFRRRNNFARLLNRSQYQKLSGVLSYKLAAVGLPPPKFVRAAFTSTMCNKCGHCAQGNRLSQAVFECQACGFSTHADMNAAANIGLKYLYWREVGPRVKGKKLTAADTFEAWLVDREDQAA